jgi:AraC-like DNA-binding protein
MFDLGLVAGASLDSACLDLLLRIGSSLPSHIHLEGEAYYRMETVLDQLHEEYSRPTHSLGRNGLLRSKLTEALLLFLRAAASGHHSSDGIDTLNKSAAVLWPLLQYLHVHYTEPLTLQGVARALHVSAPVISRTFREHTGFSFLQYLHRLRVDSAAHLLVSTELPVADITFAVGFESFRTFARVFRAIKGAPPSAYRSAGRDT